MKSKMTFIAVLTGMAAAVLVAISCNKSSFEPKGVQIDPSPTISKCLAANKILEESRPETKSFGDWFTRKWKYVKTDAAAAYKHLLTEDDLGAAIDNALIGRPGQLVQIGLRTSNAASTASNKAKEENNSGCAVVATQNDYRKAALCMTQVIQAQYYPQNGNTYSTNQNVVPVIDNVDLLLPQNYAWAGTVGQDHNWILQYLNLDSNSFDDLFGEEDTDELVELFEEMVDVDSTYCEQFLSLLNSIPYDVDYSLFFDDQDTADSILILFAEAVENYSNCAQDVAYVANQYIPIVVNSNDLEENEKAALIGAISVAAYSSVYWDNYDANTI